MIVLLGVLVVVIGFATRRNPLLVVGVAGIVTGLLGGMSPLGILDAFGEGFASSRAVTIFAITLPVIGLLERNGLQQQARTLIGKARGLTTGRFLILYLALRQLTAAVGLQSIGGPAQSVRPMIAPMAEGAAERRNGGRPLPERIREKVRSHSAASDTVGLFFGEDCFLAIGSILLITGFVNSAYGTHLEPLSLALWAIPTAACAFLVHGSRLLRLDRTLDRELAVPRSVPAPRKGSAASEEDAK
ncbi:membrane protein [Streptomycetaceae bacterium MP113-05]|nr:membrane protein [Streptomycetaceae bacterium MP113-05]